MIYLWKIIDNMRYVQFECIPDYGRINCPSIEEEKSNFDRKIFSKLEHVRCKIRGTLRAGRWFSRGKGSTPCDRFILFSF